MLLSRMLSDFAYNLKYEGIPDSTLDNARGRILDFIAAAAAGYRVNTAMNEVMLKTMRSVDCLRQASLLFGEGMLSVPGAAFANAFMGHGADLDDGHMLSSGHPGVAVVPAVLALAESEKVTAKDLLTAIVVGYDYYVRISNAIMPSHLHRGFHGTGTVGAVAAAAASAKLLHFDDEQIHKTVSLAAVSASGLFEISESGQGMKPINPANAARTGVFSALLVRNGADAPDNPLEGNRGFFKAFADTLKRDEISDHLGERFSIDSCYVKRYPACRHTHAVIDCAAAMREKGGYQLDDIESIRLYSYENSYKITGQIMEPADSGEGKFSQAYSVAMTLLNGTFSLSDLDDPANMPPAARDLIRKTTTIMEPELEDRKRMIRGGRMEMTLKDGRILETHLLVPKGEAVTPFTKEEMGAKLASCSKGVFLDHQVRQIYEQCYGLGKSSEIQELLHSISEGTN